LKKYKKTQNNKVINKEISIINIPSSSSFIDLNQSTKRFSIEKITNKKEKKNVQSAIKLALNFTFSSSFLL
jgi:hypothetical protein